MRDSRRQVPRLSPLDIADRLHSAAIHLLRRLRTEDSASGLSAPRLSALSVIVFAGPITMSDLAAAEQVSPPTISRLIKDLERDGLVRRRRDPDDRRVQRVHATKKGQRLLEEGRRRRVATLAAELERLPTVRRHDLARAIEILEELALPAQRPGAGSVRLEGRDKDPKEG